MDEIKLQQIAEALEGLTYAEWSRIPRYGQGTTCGYRGTGSLDEVGILV